MARRKKIYRDKEYELDLKRKKITDTVAGCFCAFLIADIIVMGINQYNDTVIGWGCIAIGIVSLAYVGFMCITRLYDWKLMSDFDTAEYKGRDLLGDEFYDEEMEKGRFLYGLVGVLAFVFGTAALVAGILKLIGVI